MYPSIHRIIYAWLFRLNSLRFLRNCFLLTCLSLAVIQYWLITTLNRKELPAPIKSRLYQHLPITINLSPFSVCHPNEIQTENLTSLYHQRYPDKDKQVCFLIENLGGESWWSYVTPEFAEILTHLQQLGTDDGIKYRPFPTDDNFNRRTNFTKYFLNACGMDENLPKENQTPIIVLLWNINRMLWHFKKEDWNHVLNTTRIHVVAFIDDLHFATKGTFFSRQFIFQDVAKEILSTYPYLFHNYYKNIPKEKLTWLPHAASTLSYTSINNSAENVLFVSGANLLEWYPCRARAFLLCYSQRDLAACLQHPGYGPGMKNDSSYYYGGQRYFQYMRQYVFGLATCESVHYAIAKLFEIPANGLALVTTDDLVPVLKTLGFYHNEHLLTINCSSSSNLVHELKRIKNISKEVVYKIRENSQKIVHERHLSKHRAALVHVRLLAQALLTTTASDTERIEWEQWGRNCHNH